MIYIYIYIYIYSSCRPNNIVKDKLGGHKSHIQDGRHKKLAGIEKKKYQL